MPFTCRSELHVVSPHGRAYRSHMTKDTWAFVLIGIGVAAMVHFVLAQADQPPGARVASRFAPIDVMSLMVD